MPLLEWKNEFSVGVAEFDRQHQRMFGLINGLYEAMKEGTDSHRREELLAELVDYGQTHLKAEEQAFLRYDYPDRDAHKAVHDHYREKIAWFKERQGEAVLSFEIIDFLEDWWLGHIQTADQAYAPFFAAKGVE